MHEINPAFPITEALAAAQNELRAHRRDHIHPSRVEVFVAGALWLFEKYGRRDHELEFKIEELEHALDRTSMETNK